MGAPIEWRAVADSTARPLWRDGPALAGTALAIATLALSIWRAATQSIVHDEAYTYLQHVRGPLIRAFDPAHFDANHHILHTLLCKVSTGVFGLSELSLRLPSLLGGALMLAVTWVIGLRVIGGWLGVLTLALLATNPLLLDFMSCARGYGLALALLLTALAVLALWPASAAAALTASLAMGLGAAANLSVTFEAAGLGVTAVALEGIRQRRLPWRHALALTLPGLALAAALTLPPLRGAPASLFYVGLPTLGLSIYNLVDATLFAATAPNDLLAATARWAMAVAWGAVPALFALMVSAAALPRMRRPDAERLSRCHDLLSLCVGTLLVSLALMFTANAVGGLLFPQDRTGLPLIALFCLALGALTRAGLGPQDDRWAGRMLAVMMAALCVRQALQLQVQCYGIWRYDAGTRRLAGALVNWHETQPPGTTVRLAASWRLEPSLNFYRTMWGLDWLAPVTRGSEHGAAGHFGAEGWSVCALEAADAHLVERLGLRPIGADLVSGAILAEPSS